MTFTFARFGLAAITLAAATAHAQAGAPREAAEVAECFATVERDSAFAAIRYKFVWRAPAAAQLLDQTIPSEAEAETLRRQAQALQPCRDMRLAAIEEKFPDLAPSYQTLDYQAAQVGDYLQQRAITYGTANRLAARATLAFDERRLLYADRNATEQAAMGERWREQLAKGHSNPPPSPEMFCDWEALNITCK